MNTKIAEKEIDYPINVDGQAPVTKLILHGAPSYLSTKHYFGKGLLGGLSSTDDMTKVGSTYYSVNSAPFTEYKSEVAFAEEREYLVKYLSADRVGNTEELKSKTFTVDISAPSSKHSVAIDHLYEKILSPRSVITLASTDNLSGVKKTVYNFDTNTTQAYLGKISSANLTDGEHTLNYFSTDRVNNDESSLQFPFYLDRIAPVITSQLDANFVKINDIMHVAKASTIQLTATDHKAGVKDIHYTINNGSQNLYSSSFTLPQKQGKYIVKYRGGDKVNNKGPFITDDKLGNIFLDDTAPQVSHNISTPKIRTRDTLFVTKDSKISLNSIDNESGSAHIDYKVDGGSNLTYSESFQIAGDGIHKVEYTGFDRVNNSRSKDFLVVADNVAPKLFWHFSLEKMGSKAGVPIYPIGTTIYLAATDNAVGIKGIFYKLKGQQELLTLK